MPTYANLIRLTEQEPRDDEDTLQRTQAYWDQIERAGGRVLHEVWTQAEYDR